MATEQLTGVLRRVRRLIGLRRDDDLTDGELLERFVARLDEAAFEALVRRHGPLVQRVCRRVLGDAHAAEDAFQATFLVLAKKAGAVRRRNSIAGWLYEVAYNLALRARANEARRRLHERRAGEMPPRESENVFDRQELHAALDEELHRLPEKYRTPLVLCYLEGKTNEQAAQELGWPAGSMSYRLNQARELLRKRLCGRGLALPAAGLVALLSESASPAAVSAALVKTTVRAASQYAAGKALAAGVVSADALALAEGAMHTMLTTKIKIAAGLLLALGMLGAGARVFVSADAAPPAAKAEATPGDKSGKVDALGDELPPGAVARLGSLRWRHNSPVMFVAYSPTGKEVITAAQDGAVRVWEAATGKEIRKFGKVANVGGPFPPGLMPVPQAGGAAQAKAAMMLPAMNMISCVTLSADGKTVAVGAQDGSITLWDVATGKEGKTVKSNPPVGTSALVFSADAKHLFARCYDSTIRQYDVAEAKELKKFGAPPGAINPQNFINPWQNPNSGLALSGDGKSVLMAAVEFKNNQVTGLLKVYDIAAGTEKVVTGPQMQGGFNTLTIAADGKYAAWGHFTGSILVWDVAAGKEVSKLNGQQQNPAQMMAFSADGKTLAVRNSDQAIRLWSVVEGKERVTLGEAPKPGPNGAFFGGFGWSQSNIAFAPDGKTVATGTGANTVRQFDAGTGKEVAANTSGHHGGVLTLALSPDGKTAVTRGADNTAHLWDVDGGKETKQYALPAGVQHAAFTADGKTLALGTFDGTVILWDPLAAKEIKQWKAGNQPQQGFATLAISPDGKTLAVRAFDQSIKLFDVANARELRQFADAGAAADNGAGQPLVAVAIMPGFMMSTQNLAFSPDGTLLAGMGTDKAANPNVGGPIRRPFPGQPSSLRLWDVATGKQVRQFEQPKNGAGVGSFAFAPDGRALATANYDGTVTLWESASGKERFTISFLAPPPVKGGPVPLPGPVPAPRGAGAAGAAGLAEVAEAPAVAAAQVMEARAMPVFRGNNGPTCVAYAPDGKLLAAAGPEGVVHFWDLTLNKEIATRKGHQNGVVSLAFAQNGKRLASGSQDTTALVWETPVSTEKPPAVQVEAKQAELLWGDLADADAAKAFQAVRVLSQVPKQAVPLLKDKVEAVPAPDAKKLTQLIADLDSNAFATRKKAEDELEKMGELAQDAIEKALKDKPNLETQKRLEGLLAKLVTGAAPNPQQLRTIRALEVLEAVGTPEAQDVLKAVAKGAAGARVTKDAKGALDRLGKR